MTPRPRVAPLLRLNALRRGRDSRVRPERDDNGGQYFLISLGISVSATPKLHLFLLAQLPICQYVNGAQFTVSWGATAGVGLLL